MHLDAEDEWRADERNRDVLIRHLREALGSVGGCGRFYYAGPCTGGGPEAGFPQLKLQQAMKGKTSLAVVQEIFAKDKQVTVTQDRSGMIRISVGNVPSAILQTKIHSLKLKPEERYTPQLALIAIESAKEVEAAMHTLGLEHPVVVVSIGIQYPMPGLPHLSAGITDVTLDQAFDLVAKTFGGVVTYEICMAPKGQGFFDTDFFCIACQ